MQFLTHTALVLHYSVDGSLDGSGIVFLAITDCAPLFDIGHTVHVQSVRTTLVQLLTVNYELLESCIWVGGHDEDWTGEQSDEYPVDLQHVRMVRLQQKPQESDQSS